MGFVYFVLIYNWLNDKISSFGLSLMATFMTWASAVALVLVTLWIMIQGYRLITGQSRESLMAMVMNMARIAIIVAVATTMSMFGTKLHQTFTTDLSTGINQMFTGSNQTIAQTIDENLAWTQLALGAIDAVQVPPGDDDASSSKTHAMLIAGFGTASPPMAAAAMLLLYQIALALFIGLGPLFILCLIFDQTKELFRKWLLYGIGTLFSMAMLSFVSSLVLQLTLRVDAALWSAGIINTITSQNAEGFSSQALQQGGLGLLMTALIISAPPMAATFFQGTMGSFLFQSAFGFGGARAAAMQQGLPPGAYGHGGYQPPPASIGQVNSGQLSGMGGFSNIHGATTRLSGTPNFTYVDVIRPASAPPATGGNR